MTTLSRIGIVCLSSALACGSGPAASDTEGSSTGSTDTDPSSQSSATSPSTSSTTATTDTTTDTTTDDTTGPGGSVSTSLDDGSSSGSGEPVSTGSSSDSTTTGLLGPCVDEDIGMMVGDDIVIASTVDAVDDFKLAECFSPGPSTTGADDTEGPPPPDTTSGADTGIGEFFGDDYVLQWTPPETFVYTISITGSDFDNIVGVYPAECGSEMYSCNDDCYGIDAGLQFVGTEGEPVFIVIDGRNGEVGTFSLSIEQGAGVCSGGATTG